MNRHTQNAEKVAEIAREYARRRSHHIEHTGHTVHRFLEAVSALLGRQVEITDRVGSPPAADRTPTRPTAIP